MLVLYVLRSEGFFEHDISAKIFNRCKNPCVIQENLGGSKIMYWFAARAAHRKEREYYVIDGKCGSACVLFADWARPHVCITYQAEFAIHRGTILIPFLGLVIAHVDHSHLGDIGVWITKAGGIDLSREKLLIMEYRDARQFWPDCEGESWHAKTVFPSLPQPVPLPRPDPRR